MPDDSWGGVQYAYSLHELKRIKEAQTVLLPVADKFSGERLICFKLACYCCQLGELDESMHWLGKAIDLAGKKDIRIMALNEPDLEPLWKEWSQLSDLANFPHVCRYIIADFIGDSSKFVITKICQN